MNLINTARMLTELEHIHEAQAKVLAGIRVMLAKGYTGDFEGKVYCATDYVTNAVYLWITDNLGDLLLVRRHELVVIFKANE